MLSVQEKRVILLQEGLIEAGIYAPWISAATSLLLITECMIPFLSDSTQLVSKVWFRVKLWLQENAKQEVSFSLVATAG